MKQITRTTRRLSAIAMIASAISIASGQALQDSKSGTGAEMVYGSLPGTNDLRQGLSYILKQVHGHYGDKPVLGSFFQSKAGDTVGSFFQLEDKNFTHTPQLGLVLVAKDPSGVLKAAVLTDRASQFKSSIGGMVQRIQTEWYGWGGGETGSSAAEPPQPLQPYRIPDGTGFFGLAAGWQPVEARNGGVIAVGPNGETMTTSCYLAVLSPNDPMVRRSGGGPLPGMYAAVSPGAGPAAAFDQLYAQLRQKHRMPAASSNTKLLKTENQPLGLTYILGGDLNSAQGSQIVIGFMTLKPGRGATSCIMTTVTAPKPLFSKERETMFAMANSLSQNAEVLAEKGRQAANAIRNYGQSVRDATKAKGDAFDDYMKSIDNQHDAEARISKGFQNVMLDQSVLEHIPTGSHGTVSNDWANMIVGADPQNWQTVPASQFVKGLDF